MTGAETCAAADNGSQVADRGGDLPRSVAAGLRFTLEPLLAQCGLLGPSNATWRPGSVWLRLETGSRLQISRPGGWHVRLIKLGPSKAPAACVDDVDGSLEALVVLLQAILLPPLD